jgi:hypothetical protein
MLSGAANVGHFLAGGILWQLGQVLSDQLRDLKRNKVVPEHVAVSVYETSSCSERNPVCGPGYVFSPGINPQLCFHFSFSNSLPGCSYDHDFCIFQYHALAWALSQPGLKTTLP